MAKKKQEEPKKEKIVFLPKGFSYGFEKMKNEIREKRDKINAREADRKTKKESGRDLPE